MASRVMSLTPELVARCHRVVEDSGPLAGQNQLTDGDYQELVDKTLAAWPDHSPLWLFAYGSLIWKPEIEHIEERVALLRGWHRSFCINQPRWRGTPDRPGLMMGLDRGGMCRGVAFRLPDAEPRRQLDRLFRREMTAKPSTYIPRWLRLETESGQIAALGFTVNRNGWAYAGRFPDEMWPGSLQPLAVTGDRAPTTSTTPWQTSRRAGSMTGICGDFRNWSRQKYRRAIAQLRQSSPVNWFAGPCLLDYSPSVDGSGRTERECGAGFRPKPWLPPQL